MASRSKVNLDRQVIVVSEPVNPPKKLQTGTFSTDNAVADIKVVDASSDWVHLRIGSQGDQYFEAPDLRQAAKFFTEMADVMDSND